MSAHSDESEIDKFLTIGEAAKLLGMTYKTTHRNVTNGLLKGTKKGGRYLIPREEIENFRRGLAGRPRKSVPLWRFSPDGNGLIGTSIEGELREGVTEKAFTRALAKVKNDERLQFAGTVARYVLSSEREPRRVQFLLIWRQTAMPSQEEITALLASLRETLSSALDWETARAETQRVWMHT